MTKMRFVDFCARVLGLRLSRAQRVLALVAIDNVSPRKLSAVDRKIARELFGGIDGVPAAARRIQTWSLGRGSGKTTLAAALMVYVAVTASLARVGPGMQAASVALAPKTRTARLVVQVARALVRGVPALERLVVKGDDSKEGFSLLRSDANRSVRIAAFAASRGGVNVRGFDVLTLILDEAEFFASGSEYAVTDTDSYQACVPRLLPGPDHHALFISTPWPSPTLMGELYEKNFGDPTTALAARGSTVAMRDYDPDLVAFVEGERERDPDTADREFFVSRDSAGSAEFFSGDLISSCVEDDLMLGVSIPADESRYAGADLGLIQDSSTLAIASRNDDRRIRVRELVELRPKKGEPLKLSRVIATFAGVMKGARVSSVMADQHSREPAREWAEEHEITIDDAPAGHEGKFSTFETTRRLMKEGKVRLPDHARLKAQLRSVTVSPLPAGGYKVKVPRRIGLAHGDLVSALVLAIWQAAEDDGGGEYVRLDEIGPTATYSIDDIPAGD